MQFDLFKCFSVALLPKPTEAFIFLLFDGRGGPGGGDDFLLLPDFIKNNVIMLLLYFTTNIYLKKKSRNVGNSISPQMSNQSLVVICKCKR